MVAQEHPEPSAQTPRGHGRSRAAFEKLFVTGHLKDLHSNNLGKLIRWYHRGDCTQPSLPGCLLHDMAQQAWFARGLAHS